MKVFVVVPAYNEEKRIAFALRDLKSHGYNQIVVIDDGSKDATGKEALSCGATVLTHLVNRGQGAALRTGIEYALSQGADAIVTFDSDGQHQANEIKTLLAPIKNDEADITLGSRFLGDKSKHVPILRKILLFGSRLIILIFYGLWMSDAHNGFRALGRLAATKIEIKSNRMEHASEIIGEIKNKRLRYIEVPVTIKYNQETLEKGAGGMMQALRVLAKMVIQKITR